MLTHWSMKKLTYFADNILVVFLIVNDVVLKCFFEGLTGNK